ncbi:hypothetical protein H5410_000663 [Solanum commersonii]|uniref:Uncharacterized protein n=1 Tax=Solanum commersonii TaxID=4109 RepID=A0A9J6AXF2_SOLCO|nr:hypothetical protein H5410_000663 [Solanum commersonii]
MGIAKGRSIFKDVTNKSFISISSLKILRVDSSVNQGEELKIGIEEDDDVILVRKLVRYRTLVHPMESRRSAIHQSCYSNARRRWEQSKLFLLLLQQETPFTLAAYLRVGGNIELE